MMIQRKTFLLLLALVALVAVTVGFLGGCAKKLEGNVYDNEKPIVWFVNVPPENAQSSVNPIVNWMGQDRDGQIDYYRYLVLTEAAIGDSLGKPADWNPLDESLTEAELQSFIDGNYLDMVDRPDTMRVDTTYVDAFGETRDTTLWQITRTWTYLLVRADSTDPHTSNIVPMSATMDDPVRIFVPQFVLVQAFDEEGLGSDIATRRFFRNDNPPETRIVAFVPGVPFINSVVPSGPATGIRFRWQGSDAVDYPTDAPPFEFEWKLLGPYSDDEYATILDEHLATVFVTNDAQVFQFGVRDTIGFDTFWSLDSLTIDSIVPQTMPSAYIVCDTTYSGGDLVETCDTIIIDNLEGTNVYGRVDTLLKVFQEPFMSSNLYRVADSSRDLFGNVWVTNLRDSLYNSYWNAPSDTTQVGNFIFAIRSRDDAQVPDLTPAWANFVVIDPQHERDILVMNWTATAHANIPNVNRLSEFWDRAVEEWRLAPSTIDHSDVIFDPSLDFIRNTSGWLSGTALLEKLMRYKVFVVLQDDAQSGAWSAAGDGYANVLVGLQTGVNVWVQARVPWYNHGGALTSSFSQMQTDGAYQFFFGVQETTFPGWGSELYSGRGVPRVEHFIGALALPTPTWTDLPDLRVDTALLRTRYTWLGLLEPSPRPPFYPYVPDYGAIPQVGWCVRSYETDAMYLFKSLYGQEHAIRTQLSFHGRPVGVSLNRGLFRTVHYMFSPLAMEETSGQVMINQVMNWLYDGRIVFSPDGRGDRQDVVNTANDLSQIYWNCYWEANGDPDRFRELLISSY